MTAFSCTFEQDGQRVNHLHRHDAVDSCQVTGIGHLTQREQTPQPLQTDNKLMPADRSSRITSCRSGSSGILVCSGRLVLSQSASRMPKNCAGALSNRPISMRSVVVRGHGPCSRRRQKYEDA
ncbi:hypothetical protein EYF80_063120 [Liparis tanakae]|uniref:Uncharacterized protein n=1 Tax=Liparis tanakae TaxID=230148 RepID=A0A4Z2EDC2_9TELE|nr:hypothetical protein EYF80_063120 [Liparis tanakae]